MKKRDFEDYYEKVLRDHRNSSLNSEKEISSDFSLLLRLFGALLGYVVLFVPYFFAFLFYFLSGNSFKSKEFFRKLFMEPFRIVGKIFNWFFEGRVTSFLIVLLVFVFLIQNLFVNSNEVLLNSLMNHPMHFFEGNYLSVFTSIFLHANFVHLGSNLLALLIFGRIVERYLGFKTLFVFLASGVIANIVSNVISLMIGDVFYSLGASGAIAGLIMFAILLNPFALTSVLLVPLPIFIIGWVLIISDVIGLTNPSQTNHLAHLGGYGALLILFFFLEFRERRRIITGFSMNLVLILVVYMFIKIYGLGFLGI